VRVPWDLHARSCFPCWPTYDVLWHWRLKWSQTKHALLCQQEERTQKHAARKADWDGKCGECKKKSESSESEESDRDSSSTHHRDVPSQIHELKSFDLVHARSISRNSKI
jgi:hypothetical protein